MLQTQLNLFILILVLIFSVNVVYAQDIENQNNLGTVHGYITDTTPNKIPVKHVDITVNDMRGKYILFRSAENGEFISRDLPEGDYLMHFRKSGYQSRIGLPVSVTKGESKFISLTMNKKENTLTKIRNYFNEQELQGGTIQFDIATNLPDPSPIENAVITIRPIDVVDDTNNKEIVRTSDINGQYQQDKLSAGIYIVSVGKAGYQTASFSITVEENRVKSTKIVLSQKNNTKENDESQTQNIEGEMIVRGKIVDTNFQQTSIPEVKIVIKRIGDDIGQIPDFLTTDTGEYEFELTPARHLIFLYKEGYNRAISFIGGVKGNSDSRVTILKENMFIEYDAIAYKNVLEITHGLSTMQNSFGQKYDDTSRITILCSILSLVLGGIITYFFIKYLNERQQKYNME